MGFNPKVNVKSFEKVVRRFVACASVIEQLEKRACFRRWLGAMARSPSQDRRADKITVDFSIAVSAAGRGGWQLLRWAVNGTKLQLPAEGSTQVSSMLKTATDGININGAEEDDGSASAPVNVIVNEARAMTRSIRFSASRAL